MLKPLIMYGRKSRTIRNNSPKIERHEDPKHWLSLALHILLFISFLTSLKIYWLEGWNKFHWLGLQGSSSHSYTESTSNSAPQFLASTPLIWQEHKLERNGASAMRMPFEMSLKSLWKKFSCGHCISEKFSNIICV